MTGFFMFALDVATAAQDQVSTFIFWDATLQKAVVGLLGSIALYYGARAWKLRNLTAPQRRQEDTRYAELRREMEKRTEELESKLRERVEKVEKKLDTVEGLQRNTLTDFGELKEYVHKTNHDMRDTMNRALGSLEGGLEQLSESTSAGFDRITRRVDEALGAFLRHVTQG